MIRAFFCGRVYHTDGMTVWYNGFEVPTDNAVYNHCIGKWRVRYGVV